MVKGFFFIKHGRADKHELEVTAADQPELFVFLHRLADDAKAPRPHRVFLSPRVNASVSYDLSLINFIIPSKKNLEIGLGLVNVLTLGELTAVLAHEFGHFTQRSMAVGRWLYIAQQIAGHIVARRDKFDAFLNRWTRIDLRIAWLGWLLAIIVWSIRSLVDSLFSVALRTQRALAREMEMHADLVAVSLTGSDSLIYALHRLRTADDAWDRTLAFAGSELAKGHLVKDLFAVQLRLIERMSVVDAELYRRAPALPETQPQALRLFKAELAQPPRMWSTHPPNDQRELNAKRAYISAPLDDRSGWLLFDNPQDLRDKVSTLVLGKQEKATVVDTASALRELDAQFDRESLDPRYRGIYLDRSIVRPAQRAADLYEALPHKVEETLTTLYPETLSRDVERLATLTREKSLLEAVANGMLEAPGGIVRHRDRQLRPRELPQIIAQLEQEIASVETSLWSHDKRCRTVHRAIAAEFGHGWEEYLCGLAAVLHYADHNQRNLADARDALANRVAIATAGGRARKSDIDRVVVAARAVHDALEPFFLEKQFVVLDPTLLAPLGVESWAATLEEFKLGQPAREYIGKWLGVVEGWLNAALAPLGNLRRAALDQMLKTEAQLARWRREGGTPEAAPPASGVPDNYPVLLPGGERTLDRKLDWWKRFQTADGIVPATARFLAAASIVGAVLAFGGKVGEATVTIYNGLGRPVVVGSGPKTVRVEPFSNASITLPPGVHMLRATTDNGVPIDSAQGTVNRGFGNYVYNVAGAGTLTEWTQIYGNGRKKPPRALGAAHWTETEATTLFADPPRSISTSSGGGTVTVLSGLSGESPRRVLNQLEDAREAPGVIAAHARWDAADARYTMFWLEAAKTLPTIREIVQSRLAANPTEMLALRVEQDVTTGAAHDSVCARTRARADSAPNDQDRKYLAVRCLPDENQRNRTYITLSERAPKNAWLAFAAGYSLTEESRWAEALSRLEAARAADPALAPTIVEDIARLRRMTQGQHAGLADISDLSDDLHIQVTLETGDDLDNSPYLAYTDLNRGRLTEALRRVQAMPELGRDLLPLVAASDGADSAVIENALAASPDSSMGMAKVFTLLALAIREKRDPARYIAIVKKNGVEGADRLIRFCQMLGAGGAPEAAEQALGAVSLKGRGMAYSMGVVILGRSAPPAWREGATRLLFASERPYFREHKPSTTGVTKG
jgi:Zn-dependent protease with chaperone function